MTKSLLRQFTFGGMVIAAVYALPAQAATRTWVSGTGDDFAPCSFAAPCKTFSGAMSKTDPGGEISVKDSAAYGAVTITKAITINGEGNFATILASGGTGITVAAGVGDRVILRNLHINGGVGGNTGISVNSAANVTIDNCFIYGFTTGFLGGIGVSIAANATVQVDIRNTNITHTSQAVLAQTTSGFAVVSIDNVRMNDMTGFGLEVISSGVFASIRNSFIKSAVGGGILVTAASSQVNVDHSEITNSGTAVNVQAASTVRLNNNSIYNNTTDLAISGGGTIATAGNNKTGGNGAGAVPNGTVGNL